MGYAFVLLLVVGCARGGDIRITRADGAAFATLWADGRLVHVSGEPVGEVSATRISVPQLRAEPVSVTREDLAWSDSLATARVLSQTWTVESSGQVRLDGAPWGQVEPTPSVVTPRHAALLWAIAHWNPPRPVGAAGVLDAELVGRGHLRVRVTGQLDGTVTEGDPCWEPDPCAPQEVVARWDDAGVRWPDGRFVGWDVWSPSPDGGAIVRLSPGDDVALVVDAAAETLSLTDRRYAEGFLRFVGRLETGRTEDADLRSPRLRAAVIVVDALASSFLNAPIDGGQGAKATSSAE